jgi:hypothetical protein
MKKIYPFYCVHREYERGWGSKDFHATGHETLEEAKKAVDKVNAKNTAKHAPDYYINARVETDNCYAQYLN